MVVVAADGSRGTLVTDTKQVITQLLHDLCRLTWLDSFRVVRNEDRLFSLDADDTHLLLLVASATTREVGMNSDGEPSCRRCSCRRP
jgi:hypothetical protein